jgi:hypothetical protein
LYNAGLMREWDLTSADPLSLFLAADARFCSPDYSDDQVWELILRGGDPPAMAVETMLGLRAVSLRLFPVFTFGGRPLHNPAAFSSPPVVRRFAPNYINVSCRPIPAVGAECEYWVPESHALAGRITFSTTGTEPVSGECAMAGILRPSAEGAAFVPDSAGPYEGVYLRGGVRGAVPVLVAAEAGGIGRGAIPSVKAAFELDASRPHSFRWVFCCHPAADESLRCARAILARVWDAEIARIELAGESLLEIETGRRDWDAILAFSQQTAVQSLIGPTRALPYPSPVVGRNPERGFSLRGDGSDYPPAWGGADLSEVLMVLPVWALALPECAKDLLRNYLAASGEGLPDARPGAGKQRAGLLAPPLLGQAAERALGGRAGDAFLASLQPVVERCLEAWFGPDHDRDRDGAPEWDRPDSFGPHIPAMWAREDPWGGWIPPEETESPSLAALLLGECLAAARIAERAGDGGRAKGWRERGGDVRHALERMEAPDGYRTIDRITHASPAGKILWEGGTGDVVKGSVSLLQPARLLLRCAGSQETRPLIELALEGKNAEGAECREIFRSEQFSWHRGRGTCFSRTVWIRINSIRVEGPAAAGMRFSLEIPNLAREDLSHFLPLWSRAVSAERAQKMFARLGEGAEYASPCGLRFLPRSDPAAGNTSAGGVWMFWNMLIGEAAIRYGRGDLAYAWTGKWMHALAGALRADRSFRSCYDPERAAGSGPRNSLQGIFPVGFFLAALGVHPVASQRVWAGGRSIFPFPVTVRWRGMTIRREGESVQVEFPSGVRREFHGTQRTLITDEE